MERPQWQPADGRGSGHLTVHVQDDPELRFICAVIASRFGTKDALPTSIKLYVVSEQNTDTIAVRDHLRRALGLEQTQPGDKPVTRETLANGAKVRFIDLGQTGVNPSGPEIADALAGPGFVVVTSAERLATPSPDLVLHLRRLPPPTKGKRKPYLCTVELTTLTLTASALTTLLSPRYRNMNPEYAALKEARTTPT